MDTERVQRGWLVPIGFAMSVTMWLAAYLGRLPLVMAPSWLVGLVMLAVVVAWGYRVGLWLDSGAAAAAKAGLLCAVINMLILGSLLSSPEGSSLIPSALWWIPGSLFLTGFLAGAAGRFGSARPRRKAPSWPALFSKTALGATFLLVVAGGLVTSNEAGLAVVDWPNSYGYNMFLYPLSKMTGGIFYEHAHRLFGSLVGLTTIALALYVRRFDGRRWVKNLSGVAVGVVVVQGILGGLRVTGSFTWSTDPEAMAPSIVLAVIHGVLGQMFLAIMAALAVGMSEFWQNGDAAGVRSRRGDLDRLLQGWLLAVLLIQLVFGAVQRHVAWGLVIHITLAAVVWMLASVAGARGWWLWPDGSVVSRLGKAVLITGGIQVLLGLIALALTAGEAVVGDPRVSEVLATTAHQACGALLLAFSVAFALSAARFAKA